MFFSWLKEAIEIALPTEEIINNFIK